MHGSIAERREWSGHVTEPVDDVEDDERQRKEYARQSVDVVCAPLLHGHDAPLQSEAELANWLGDRRQQVRVRRRRRWRHLPTSRSLMYSQ